MSYLIARRNKRPCVRLLCKSIRLPLRCAFLPKIHGFTRIWAATVFVMSKGKVHADVISPHCVIRTHMKNNCRGHTASPGEPSAMALTAPQISTLPNLPCWCLSVPGDLTQLPSANQLGHVAQGHTVIGAGISAGEAGLLPRWGKTLMRLVGRSRKANRASMAGLSLYFI